MTHRTSPKCSLMKRSVILLLLLILPFNIIGILTSVLSYRNSVKSAENAINYTLDSYVTLLDNEISNTDSMLYELTNNNLVFSMCNMEKDSEYMIYRFQLSTDTKDQMRVSNVADTIFLYLDNTSDYIQFPGYDAATAGTKPYYKYIQNYNMDFSHWFLTEDKTMLVRVLHDLYSDNVSVAVLKGKWGHLNNFEFVMNRAYALNRDRLKCRVCGCWLIDHAPFTHRINPRLPIDKVNRVNNLISLDRKCYKAINSPDMDISSFDKQIQKRINSYREKLVISHASNN